MWKKALATTSDVVMSLCQRRADASRETEMNVHLQVSPEIALQMVALILAGLATLWRGRK
jgi:hypothetical protein